MTAREANLTTSITVMGCALWLIGQTNWNNPHLSTFSPKPNDSNRMDGRGGRRGGRGDDEFSLSPKHKPSASGIAKTDCASFAVTLN